MQGRFSAWLLHQIRLYLLALQFFTRIPVPAAVGFEPLWLQQSARYFPWVGILVGAFTALLYWLANLCWPPLVAVLLSTAGGVWLTGAFHEDGFADVCDGFGGSVSAARVFEIMKDSRLGTYGSVGLGLLMALKVASLASMPPPLALAALLLAHPLSRLFPTLMLWRMRYAREEGKAKPMAEQMSGRECLIALVGALLPAVGLLAAGVLRWQSLLLAVLLATLACGWLVRMFLRRINGFTGDCLGATQQLTEVALYLGLLAKCNWF